MGHLYPQHVKGLPSIAHPNKTQTKAVLTASSITHQLHPRRIRAYPYKLSSTSHPARSNALFRPGKSRNRPK